MTEITNADSELAAKVAVLVTGATGLVGRRLLPALASRFGEVRRLSRAVAEDGVDPTCFRWDGVDPGEDALRGTRAIVHLAGEPIFGGLPTAARRERILRSRVDSTRKIVARIGSLPPDARPEVLVCASAVGYYGDRGEERLEESAEPGTGFLADVCQRWEAEAERAKGFGLRVVRVRIGVVLSNEGGALALMKLPFKAGVGGRLGSGRQFFAWIHIDDLVGVLLWCLDSSIEGAVNAVAPEAVRNQDLTRELGRVLGRPTFLPVPGFAMRAALGELAGELLGSRRVVGRRLEEEGFAFRHPTLASALSAELG